MAGEDTGGGGWSKLAVGADLALATSSARAQIVFGLGPARAVHDPRERGGRILAALSERLDGIRWCEQIHSAILASLSGDAGHPLSGAACVGRGDGLLTAEPGLGLLVWTADCVPVVVVGRESLAVLHAGWRGCAQDIIGRGLRRLQVEYGEAMDNLEVFLGPAIDRCHYQVGGEVVEALAGLVPDDRAWRYDDAVDLRAFLGERAHRAGVPLAAIHRVGGCTACSPELASYRRDGARAGRQWSLAYFGSATAVPLS